MDRVLAVTVLLLLQTAPLLSRHLPPIRSRTASPADLAPDELVGSPDGLLPDHRVDLSVDRVNRPDDERMGEPIVSDVQTSAERFGYLSSNVASPLQNPFPYPPPAPAPSMFDPDVFLDPEPSLDLLPRPFSPISSVSISSGHFPEVVTEYLPQPSNQRPHKIRVNKLYNDEGKLWTKFPHKKQLVEIVPIRHKDKLVKGKSKALAYILPKSNIGKQKLNKQKLINGMYIDKHNLNDINFESSEENLSIDDTADLKDSNASENSDSSESSSTENDYDYNVKPPHLLDSLLPPAYQAKVNDDNLNLDDIINNKIDDIVNYFKKKNDGSTDDEELIHDVLSDSDDDPDYRVHYIIHKKNHQNKNIRPQRGPHNVHHKQSARKDLNVINDGSIDEELEKQLHLLPQDEVYSEYVNGPAHAVIKKDYDNPHHHKKLGDFKEDINIRKVLNDIKDADKRPFSSSHHSPNVIDENYINSYDDKMYKTQHGSNMQDILNPIQEHDKVPKHHTHNVRDKKWNPAHNHNSAISYSTDEGFRQSQTSITHSDYKDAIYDNIYNIIREIDPNTGYIDDTQTIPHQEYHQVYSHADSNGNNMVSNKDSEPLAIKASTSKSQIKNVSTSLSTESIEESNALIQDANVSQPELESSTSSSSENGVSASSSESEQYITNDEHPNGNEESAELQSINYIPDEIIHPDGVSPDDVLPEEYPHGLDQEGSSEESSSEEKSVEHLEKPYENGAEINLNDVVGQDLKELPDCFQLKQQKAKGHSFDCFGHKSYKLTFLFNR